MIANLASDIQNQLPASIMGGFTFATALAWMDAIRWVIAQIVKVPRTSGTYYLLSALATSLLAVLVYTLINQFTKVDPPEQIVEKLTA